MDTRQGRPLGGRRALVVGGSGGIGAALAAALAARGADLIIHGGSSMPRLEASIQRARAARAEPDSRVEGFLLPLQGPREIVAMLPTLGQVDILACAFGPFLRAPLHETGAEDWERLALLDLALPGALASALVGAMADRGWGRILLFGGTRTDSIRAYSSNAAYAAAKTGLAVLVKSLAAEYSARGVGAFLLCPGFVDTEYLDRSSKEELAARAPKGLLIEAPALADFGADLVAADPPLASGAVINLDGGLKL